jgi:membrane peptidoglycan carboxypeptidase
VLTALKYLVIAGLVGALVLVGTFYIAYRATDIPSANSAFQSQTTNVYYAGGKSKIGRFATQNRESIPLADVPKVMQDAVVAAEDRTFWTNNGIDPKGIIRAAFSNAKGGATQGASTITQQYVKILYLTQQRTLKRKIKEAFLSLKIQQQQSKSQILEGYLNTIYFGRGAYGIQAAANAYFGIPAKQLNTSQSAMLAAVLNSPNYLSPDRSDASRQALLDRYDYVVSGMAKMGAISASDAAEISGKLPQMKKPTTSNLYGDQRGFMLDLVKKELVRLGFDEQEIETGGLRVTTTFTKKAMDAAKSAVQQERPDGFSVKQLLVGVASVDVATGALLGFYGGQDYLKSQINWAAAADSPGSAFKPFAVAAGIKDGFSLKDTFQGNSPYTFPDGSTVVNEGEGGGTDYGAKVSLTTATQKSINTAFIDMTQAMDNGPKKIRDMAVAMGLPDKPSLEANAGISLGSAPETPIDMANAYATIADGGLHHDWFVVSKVTRASNGQVLYTAPRKTNRVVSADITADTSYAMQQVVKAGTGVKAQRIGRPAAGKTGTATNDKGDVVTSWFVGFTPQVSTAVMYVRGNGRKPLSGWLPSYFGADYPTATWAATMSALMEGLPVENFPPPANLDGTAPSTGHDPYTPPPPKPKKTKTPKPTPTPTPTQAPPPPPASTPPPPSPTITLGGGGGGGNGSPSPSP